MINFKRQKLKDYEVEVKIKLEPNYIYIELIMLGDKEGDSLLNYWKKPPT